MSNNIMTLKSGSKVNQGHRNWHVSIRHLWLPIFLSNHMGLSCTVSETDGDFCRISIANFSHSRVFNAPTEGITPRSRYPRRGLKN